MFELIACVLMMPTVWAAFLYVSWNLADTYPHPGFMGLFIAHAICTGIAATAASFFVYTQL
ncbi:MAG: hypothetical protein AAF709_21560 [Pseudomonadota bacterium]